MSDSCLAKLVGRPDKRTVEVKSGPGLGRSLVMQAPKGAMGLPVLEVKPDEFNSSRFGKVYQWIKVRFANGREGWVRDDHVEIIGACRTVGYRELNEYVNANSLTKGAAESTDSGSRRFRLGNPSRDADEHAKKHTRRDPCRATITGIPDMAFVRVRSGPGTNNSESFQVDKGTANAGVIEVKEDTQKHKLDGKVHQWLHLVFHDGRAGWVRDDLVSIQGECEAYGYEDIEAPRRAFDVPYHALVSTPGGTPRHQIVKVDTKGPCTGRMGGRWASVRVGPHPTRHAEIVKLAPGTRASIFEVRPQEGGGAIVWVQVKVDGKAGWVRKDLMSFESDCEQFNIRSETGDLFPCPLKTSVWVRGFHATHDGWDLTGKEIFSAPVRGRVVRAHRCTKCTPSKPTFAHHGIALGNRDALNDASWGWGFGHHVVVRYKWDVLPAKSKEWLTNNGKQGWHIFALYGHMKTMEVSNNVDLPGETLLGEVGNTGNSTGPHLHLEVKASRGEGMSGGDRYGKKTLLKPDHFFLKR